MWERGRGGHSFRAFSPVRPGRRFPSVKPPPTSAFYTSLRKIDTAREGFGRARIQRARERRARTQFEFGAVRATSRESSRSRTVPGASKWPSLSRSLSARERRASAAAASSWPGFALPPRQLLRAGHFERRSHKKK